MANRYVVRLTDEEREHLWALTRKGKQILLLADQGQTDEQIAAGLHGGLSTVARPRQRFVEEGRDATLVDRHFDSVAGCKILRRKALIPGPCP